MRRFRLFLLAFALFTVFLGGTALAASLEYTSAPHVLRPGKYYDIVVTASADTTVSLTLCDLQENAVYTIYEEFPLLAGTNTLLWDGMRQDSSTIDTGEYLLRLASADGTQVHAPVRISTPYPLIVQLMQSESVVSAENAADITFTLSEAGLLSVDIISFADGGTHSLGALDMQAGPGSFQWAGAVDNESLPAGMYAMDLTLKNAAGQESISHRIVFEVAGGGAKPEGNAQVSVIDKTPEPTPEPTPAPTTPVSSPYSTVDDGSFWAMTPGETDEAVVWDILTQPITVYDDGKITATEHVYLMENPDGTGAQVAQIHGKSQGLHIIGETNEYGYVLAEAFSNYDPSFQPLTDEARAQAFDPKQGYIKADGLKTIEVMQDIAFVIDKLTQRMYMYIDGEPVTEFLIATGKISEGKYYNETIPGEYITISHTGGFTSGNMYCDMAIRINGGILLHEVPHKINADGTKNYSSFEGYLGTKQSHGCIRIQRLKTPEGYNHRWIWDKLDRKGGYKVIIWDDLSRVDSPTTWQPNP